jgi:hypothetical protein
MVETSEYAIIDTIVTFVINNIKPIIIGFFVLVFIIVVVLLITSTSNDTDIAETFAIEKRKNKFKTLQQTSY